MYLHFLGLQGLPYSPTYISKHLAKVPTLSLEPITRDACGCASVSQASFNISPKSFLILLNNFSTVFTSDSLLASLSNRLSFYAFAIPPCTYDNTQATWVVATLSVIFILRYKQAVLMNALTFSIFPPNT